MTSEALVCKKCRAPIDVQRVLNEAEYAWNSTGAIWWSCPACGTGNHVRFAKNSIGVIEITGAPGPTWEYLQQASAPGVKCIHEPGGLKVLYSDHWWFVEYKGFN